MSRHPCLNALGALGLALLLPTSAQADGVIFRFEEQVSARNKNGYDDRREQLHSDKLRTRLWGKLRLKITEERTESKARAAGEDVLDDYRDRLYPLAGVLLAGEVNESEAVRPSGDVAADARVQGTFLVPEALPLDSSLLDSRQIAEDLELRLAIETQTGGQVLVPVSARELFRLLNDPRAVKQSVLGAVVRQAWRQARGDRHRWSSGGLIHLEAYARTVRGTWELPNLNVVLGIRLKGANEPEELPTVDAELSESLSVAFRRAEAMRLQGHQAAWNTLAGLRGRPVDALDGQARAVVLKIAGVGGGMTQRLSSD